MFRDKLTRLARIQVQQRVVSPVIIKTKPGKYREVAELIRPFVQRLEGILPELLPRLRAPAIIPFTPYPMKVIPRFNIVASLLPREIIYRLAESRYVEKIYPDPIMRISQYPVVPAEGVFRAPHKVIKEIVFTSTFWVKRAVGADVANRKGFTGRGVLACTIDTGASRVHEQTRKVIFKSTIPPQQRDENGHGCIEPEAYVFTSFCGIEKIRDVYSALANKYGEVESDMGKTVVPKEDIYTVGYRDGRAVKTRILAVHKIPVRGRVVRVKAAGGSEFLTTSWHPFLVYDYRYGKPKYVKAEELNRRVHALVRPDRFVELGSHRIDPRLAYIIGFFIGDGHLPLKSDNGVSLFFGNEVPRQILKILEELGYTFSVYKQRTCVRVDVYGGLRRVLLDYGFKPGKKALTVEIPKKLLLSRGETILSLLAGIIDSDGHFDEDRARLRIITHSEKLAVQLVHLLSAFGLDARLGKYGSTGRVHTIRGKPVADRSVSYSVSVIGDSYFKLVEWLSPYLILKKPRFRGSHRPHKHYWVLEKSFEDYNGYFYDFTTETGNYLAGKGGLCFIHNTWVTSCIGGVVAIDEYLSQRSGKRILCEGMAPGCGLLAVKSLGYITGIGSTSNIIEGIDIAIEYGASVINLSLGGLCEVETPQEDPYFDVFREVLKYNVIPVAAAGNSGPGSGTIEMPGALEEVLTVGAYDPITGKVAQFSSRGPTKWNTIKPDIIMPGVNIDSGTDGVCDTAGDGVPSRYSPLSGTSMATPVAAGLITLMRQCHRDVLGRILTMDEIKAMMSELGHEKNPTSGWGTMTWQMYEHWLSTQYSVEL